MAVAKKAVKKTAVASNSKEVYGWTNEYGELGTTRFSSVKTAEEDILLEQNGDDGVIEIWKLVKKVKIKTTVEEVK